MPPAPSPALPRYVELVRVSSSGQAARDTPEDQRAALERLRVARPGVLVERIEVAEGVSGALAAAARPDLRRLLELAQARAFDEVRVRHLDRLTRHDDPRERFAVYGIIADAGAIVVDATGREIAPSSDLGELTWYFETLMASKERKRIAERTRAAKDRLVREGRLVNGRPPFARTYDRKTGAWGVDARAAAVLRRLFDLCLAGRSLRAIVRTLQADGLPGPTGGAWSPAQVSRLLRDRAAVGEYVSQGVTIRVAPLVDEETFRAAGERLRVNDSNSGPIAKHPALLRKLLACGVCGSPMYTIKGGRTRSPAVYYLCSARDPACRAYHRVARVDEAVREVVEAFLRRPAALRAAAGIESPEDEAERAREDAALAERELSRLGRRLANLVRMETDEQLPPEIGRGQRAEIRAARARAEADLAAAQARERAAERRTEIAADLEARVAEIRAGLDAATFDDWRALLALLAPRTPATGVEIWPDGRIVLRGVIGLDVGGEAQLAGAARPAEVVPLRLTASAPPRRVPRPGIR